MRKLIISIICILVLFASFVFAIDGRMGFFDLTKSGRQYSVPRTTDLGEPIASRMVITSGGSVYEQYSDGPTFLRYLSWIDKFKTFFGSSFPREAMYCGTEAWCLSKINDPIHNYYGGYIVTNCKNGLDYAFKKGESSSAFCEGSGGSTGGTSDTVSPTDPSCPWNYCSTDDCKANYQNYCNKDYKVVYYVSYANGVCSFTKSGTSCDPTKMTISPIKGQVVYQEPGEDEEEPPGECADFQYACLESRNVIYVFECGVYKQLGNCPSGTKCNKDNRLETFTERSLSLLQERMCEGEDEEAPPGECADFQYDCWESRNVIYVRECGVYKGLGNCPSGTKCNPDNRLETITERSLSLLQERMCEGGQPPSGKVEPQKECTANNNCKNKIATPYCDTSANTCVECLNDAHCLDASKPKCSNKKCAAEGVPPVTSACCEPSKCKITATQPIISTGENSIVAGFVVKNEEACDINWDLTFFMTTQKTGGTEAIIKPTPTDCIIGNMRSPAVAVKLKSGDTAEITLKQDGLGFGTYGVTLFSTKDKCTSKLWSSPFQSGKNVGPITITGKVCTADYKKCEAGSLKICEKNEKEQTQVCASGKCTDDGKECWIDQSRSCDDYPIEIICGTDGKTYNNTCYLELANAASEKAITIEHLGKCGVEDWSIIAKIILGVIVLGILWYVINKI